MNGFRTLTESISDDRLAAAQFRAMLASTSQGIIGVDRTGTIQLVNSQAETQFGYAPGELLGRNIEVLVPERVRHIHAEEVREYSESPRARPMGIGMELKGRRRDGSEFPIEISLNHVAAGDETIVIGLITDITERIAMEERLRHEHRMEAVGQLAAGLAHEFNNLLTVIAGHAGMVLNRCGDDAVARSSLESISMAADRAGFLTRQLLTFSRSQAARVQWFDLNDRLSRMDAILAGLGGDHIELDFGLGENVGEILADPHQMDDVILNLVRNACDAMPHGGRLTIETSAVEVDESYSAGPLPLNPGPHVILAVIDTGAGMTPEVQERIFEPFFTTKPVGQGTGLGLAAVYGIVRDCGGSILVSSTPDRGTSFQVIFPRIWKVREQ
jgi:PAS domain S-box-containing protein